MKKFRIIKHEVFYLIKYNELALSSNLPQSDLLSVERNEGDLVKGDSLSGYKT